MIPARGLPQTRPLQQPLQPTRVAEAPGMKLPARGAWSKAGGAHLEPGAPITRTAQGFLATNYRKEVPSKVRMLAMEYDFKGDFTITGKPVLLRAEKPTAQGETGFRVWDAGMILAKWLETTVKPSDTVLDLGCGSGLSGIAAAFCGAHTTLSDKSAIEARTQENIRLNAATIGNAGGRCEFKPLDWMQLPPKNTPLTQVGFPLNNYKYIVASDVLWAPIFIKPFLEVLQLCVKDPSSTIVVVQKVRDEGVDQAFISALSQYGFALDRSVVSTEIVDKAVSNEVTWFYFLKKI
jgi:predicted nicotinamide N-methyase